MVFSNLTHYAENAQLDPLFRVQPNLGQCASGVHGCEQISNRGKYRDVNAIQLSDDGSNLLVLHNSGSLLDVWVLSTSTLVGRWRLGNSYTAMCHSGNDIVLGRHDAGHNLLVGGSFHIGTYGVERSNVAEKTISVVV